MKNLGSGYIFHTILFSLMYMYLKFSIKRMLGRSVNKNILALFLSLVFKFFIFIGPLRFSAPFLVHFDHSHFPRQSISLIKFDSINLHINLFGCIVISVFISNAFSHFDQTYQSIFINLFQEPAFLLLNDVFCLLNFCLKFIVFFYIIAVYVISFQVSFSIRPYIFNLPCFQVNPFKAKKFLFLV